MALIPQNPGWPNEPPPHGTGIAVGAHKPRVPAPGPEAPPDGIQPPPQPPPTAAQQGQAYFDQARGVQGNYDVNAPRLEAQTRSVRGNELSGQQLEDLLDYNSPLMRRARQQGMDTANARGLLNSSIASGNAMGAMIDRATPLAMQQADAYGRTASENMSATNAARTQDAINRMNAGNASAQRRFNQDQSLRDALMQQGINVENREDTQKFNRAERVFGQRWQSGENEADRDFRRDERLGTQDWQTGERLGTQDWQTGERMGDQEFRTGERLGAQAWQDLNREDQQAFQGKQADIERAWRTGERRDTQEYQTAERIATQVWQSGERSLDRDQQAMLQQTGFDHQLLVQSNEQDFKSAQAGLDRELQREGLSLQERTAIMNALTQDRMAYNQSFGQVLASIYSNPEMNASQQNQAAGNARAVWDFWNQRDAPPPFNPDLFPEYAGLFNRATNNPDNGSGNPYYNPWGDPWGGGG